MQTVVFGIATQCVAVCGSVCCVVIVDCPIIYITYTSKGERLRRVTDRHILDIPLSAI